MKKTNPLVLTSLLSLSAWSLPAFAQDNATAVPAGPPRRAPAPAPEVVPAVPAPRHRRAAPKKKGGSGPALGLDPNAPQVGGLVTTTVGCAGGGRGAGDRGVEVRRDGVLPGAAALLVGPADDAESRHRGRRGARGRSSGRRRWCRTANYIDTRATRTGMVGPWTELNFHYGNHRVKATVQIASYNITDSGYRRLESNLGINEAFLSMTWPEFVSENARLTLIAGRVHEPLRGGGAIRRRAVRDVPVRADAHGGGDADVRLRLERLDVRGRRKGSAASWSRSRSTGRRWGTSRA